MLSAFGMNLGSAQRKYRQFVSEGKNQPSPWESLQNQVFLGSEEYVKGIFKKIDLKQDLSEIPMSQRREKAKYLLWYEEKSETRNEAIKLTDASGGYRMKEIGDYYHLHYSRVSRIIAHQKKAKDKTRYFFLFHFEVTASCLG